MICPHCGAWAKVLSTRTQSGGHLTRRRYECANEHRFTTTEVHQAVYCSAKQRHVAHLQTVQARIARYKRNARIKQMRSSGQSGVQIAEALGISTSLVSLIK